ncbi:hypothetical protein [Erwinia pyrifoliae]|uniref:Lipoprotein n=1 Tax=Erwinia pyrifoliae TaxID=79967 RepID=A0ABY5XBN4_ERWPY|nr:hypothetical protein [Erwinia pyrifoliae]AUX73040.1 hypothetical protein CPI84_11450 [Erwinia pyrifoliae]MCA8876682.1 hypothetical protein [Erwinia pyrifoliae]UWS34788.1 hypothetical protein NYP84_06410 [Erwinia pyrifoliae]UXK10981.1 hypothetical protein NYP80_11585 [Erwinia pyrifoliae]CAX55228.1 uncharacterized protein EpC_14490 [Erwinia pyrifoliae Ep1/96]
MKNTIAVLCVSASFALAGCQQLSDATGKVGQSINSSLSSLGNALSPSGNKSNTDVADNLPVNTVNGLGAICRDYEANAMAGKENWIGKKISISNATVLEAQEAYDTMKYLGAQRDHKTYAIIFQTADTKYCGGAVLLSYYPSQDDDILKFKKGQKVNITGVIYDIGDRTFGTHNNGNMASKVIKMQNGMIH